MYVTHTQHRIHRDMFNYFAVFFFFFLQMWVELNAKNKKKQSQKKKTKEMPMILLIRIVCCISWVYVLVHNDDASRLEIPHALWPFCVCWSTRYEHIIIQLTGNENEDAIEAIDVKKTE